MFFFSYPITNTETKVESLDLESGTVIRIKRLEKCLLLLRTFSHILFICHHVWSVVTGSFICSDAIKNNTKKLVDSCNHGAVFATNWNFTSIILSTTQLMGIGLITTLAKCGLVIANRNKGMKTENEKLFDRSDAKLYWRTVLHFFSLLHHGYTGLNAYVISLDLVGHHEDELRKLYTFKAGYLTGWNFTFQAIFLVLAFIHDVCEWRNIQESPRVKKIAYWRDIVFTSMVVPYTLFVSSMFWSLYLYDRELVFPKVYDQILPWWFNHCVHTNITIIVLVETVLQARRHPVNFKLEIIITSVIAVAYAIVYYSIFLFAHRWLYNIFGVLTWWQVVIYQILIWASSYIFYFIQFPINRLIHGSEPITEKTVDPVGTGPEELTENETRKDGNGFAKNFEISSMQKADAKDGPLSDNWSLKYRSLRDKFENSRL